MRSGVGGRWAARAAAISCLSCSTAVFAQGTIAPAPVATQPAVSAQPATSPPEIDPTEPLDPLPDIGVDWPDPTQEDAPDPLLDVEPETAEPGVEAAPEETAIVEADPDEALTEIRYVVRLEGVDDVGDATFQTRFEGLSNLEKGEGEPANVAQINRRADEDVELLQSLLRAYGHYDATVTSRVQNRGSREPIEVILAATPGPLYRFTEVDLPGIEAAGAQTPALREAFGIQVGEPVLADDVVAGEAALKVELGNQGYPFARVGEHDIVIDHTDDDAQLTLPVDPNGRRRFGDIRVTGAPPFSPRHVGVIARFEEGEWYDQSLVVDLRRALVGTGLVSEATVEPVAIEGSDAVDIAVTLAPAPFRTIAGELGFNTGEGFRVEGSWQHRNFFNPEGAVTFRGILGTEEQLLSAGLRRSNFRRRDQVLNALIQASNTNRDAFDAKTFTLAGNIERQSNIIWQKEWTWSVGAELIASDELDRSQPVGDDDRRRTFFIGALPGSLLYDQSDDLLNPTRGFRLGGRLSPEVSLQNSVFGYARAQVDGSVYVPFGERVVLAARTRLGIIAGASRDRIAPSRRLYAGGGGSVRGYSYQGIGPRDADNDPLGGRSLAEFSVEGRVRLPFFGGNFGVVPFIDAGSLSTSLYPRLDDLRFGAGVGIRYYSNFGPIRIDLGTPLNPRKGDPRIAVYVSLGQAF